MTDKAEQQVQIRLDKDVAEKLDVIRVNCAWPVSMAVLANFSIREGLVRTKRVFNPKKK